MIQILYGCLLGVWRRWFGGGFDKFCDNRFLQHCVGFMLAFVFLPTTGCNMYQAIIGALILQGLFWARSHGCCFDLGHGTVDESRYNQLWYWKYVKKFIPESMWYSKSCDFILLTIRYTLPAILLSLVLLSPQLLVAGFVVAGTYSFMWNMYDFGVTKNPTEISEYLSGFFIGLLLTM